MVCIRGLSVWECVFVCVCVRGNGLVSGVKQTTWELFLGISVCSPSLCLSFYVCVWYMTLAIWRRYHALPLQAAWKGAEKPDELKPLFNKTSESFSNTRLRCPSNWLLDFRIYMNPPKAAYLFSDAPWVCTHSLLMWISINSCNFLFVFLFFLFFPRYNKCKTVHSRQFEGFIKCLNVFILIYLAKINLNPWILSTFVFYWITDSA